MLRVLIVEDEAWIRQGLIKSINWEKLNMVLAGEAENGEAALQLLSGTKVDIILTDMKMPVCDGKSLLQEIERRALDCEIIILSEYTDFVYTRQAIHSHVSDYLLKPVDPQHLNDVLSEAAKRLTEQQLHRISKDPYRNLFQAALSHGSDAQYLAVYWKYAAKLRSGDIVVSAVQLEDAPAEPDGLPPELRRQLERAPYRTQALRDHTGLPIFYLFSMIPGRYTAAHDKIYREWLQILFSSLQTGGKRLRIGIAREAASADKLRKSVAEAADALQYLRCGQGDIIHFDCVSASATQPLPQAWNEAQLVELLSRCAKQEAAVVKQALLQTFCRQELGYLPALRSALIDFTLTLERCSGKAGYTVNITNALGENYIDRIGRIEWPEEAGQFLDEMLQTVLDMIASKRALTTTDVVDEIIRQIESQYMDEISLMQISQRYHINYVHLSRRFKEHTGKTFTEYLLQVRMHKARQLMQTYGYSLKQAAPLVGYSNPYYFISSYKRYFEQETEEQT